MLWRTPQNLCTDRGTVMWTNSYHPQQSPSDLLFFHPRAVGEKNFAVWTKIRTNGAHPKAPSPVK